MDVRRLMKVIGLQQQWGWKEAVVNGGYHRKYSRQTQYLLGMGLDEQVREEYSSGVLESWKDKSFWT